ncbi:di-trans,poly-cis-decaprenylcistransferase [bacterium]|nr:di-trans,poly-cis-decaprenylcistransferase [bacterium]
MTSFRGNILQKKPYPDDETGLKDYILSLRGKPEHIAFIMDGNGRWAHQRALPRIAGHHQGVKTVRRMVEAGPEIGVKVMTFYTFSAENWKRPKQEVSALMELLLNSINQELEDLKRNEVSLRVIGNLDALPQGPREALKKAIIETADNKRLVLVLAISYSGRSDIVNAVNNIIASKVNKIDEESFAAYLSTAGLPHPDLLIRTSGEYRLSNFLLYEVAYSEILVSKKFWPDFSLYDLYEAVAIYLNRERRFGLTSEQVSK